MSRRQRIGLVVAGLLAAGSVALAVAAIYPRVQHRRRLAAAIEAVEREWRDPRSLVFNAESRALWRLLAFEDAEVPLTLLGIVERRSVLQNPLRLAVELHVASPGSPDARLVRRLEALARDVRADDPDRFLACYLLEELREPTYPREPEGFAPSDARLRIPGGVRLRDLVEGLEGVVAVPIDVDPRCAELELENLELEDRPWRALIQLAQLHGVFGLQVEGGRVKVVHRERWSFSSGDSGGGCLAQLKCVLLTSIRVVPPARIEGVRPAAAPRAGEVPLPDGGFDASDPLKALRALAAFNGCSVHAVAGGYDIRKP